MYDGGKINLSGSYIMATRAASWIFWEGSIKTYIAVKAGATLKGAPYYLNKQGEKNERFL